MIIKKALLFAFAIIAISGNFNINCAEAEAELKTSQCCETTHLIFSGFFSVTFILQSVQALTTGQCQAEWGILIGSGATLSSLCIWYWRRQAEKAQRQIDERAELLIRPAAAVHIV